MGMLLRGVKLLFPVGVQPGTAEPAVILLDVEGVDQSIYRARGPFGLQYHGIGQYGIAAEVEDDAEVVEVVAHEQGFFLVHAVGVAYLEIAVEGDVILPLVLESVAGIEPAFGQFVQQVGHPGEGGADGSGEVRDMGAGEAAYLEKTHNVGEFFFVGGFRYGNGAVFRFVHHHDDRAFCSQEFDRIEPVVEALGFFFFSRFPDEEV